MCDPEPIADESLLKLLKWRKERNPLQPSQQLPTWSPCAGTYCAVWYKKENIYAISQQPLSTPNNQISCL
jgi:hypothetical protein